MHIDVLQVLFNFYVICGSQILWSLNFVEWNVWIINKIKIM